MIPSQPEIHPLCLTVYTTPLLNHARSATPRSRFLSKARSSNVNLSATATYATDCYLLPELALQRIEAQTSLVLSRQISTPNIASKGKLLPRTVLVPSAIPAAPHKRPLIEEISSSSPAVAVSGHAKSDAPAKGILKPTTASAPPSTTTSRLTWRWSKTPTGAIEITIVIPFLVRPTTHYISIYHTSYSTLHPDSRSSYRDDARVGSATVNPRCAGPPATGYKRRRLRR